MSGAYMILVGLLVLYFGWTGRMAPLLSELQNPTPTGYNNISLSQFALGAFISSLPLAMLRDRPDWQRGYITLMLVSVAVYNYKGLQTFANRLSGLLS